MEIDTFDSAGWIGVVPFFMAATRPRCMPPFPPVGNFAELNVRTYVRVNGVAGVYFFSLDACSPLAVKLARRFFHLNYRHARMSHRRESGWIEYQSQRTDRLDPGAALHVRFKSSDTMQTPARGTLESFLTDRWCLFSASKDGRVFQGDIHHAPWQLGNTQVSIETDTMTEFLNLSRPPGQPHAMYAAGVDVRAWLPRRVV